MQQPFDCQNCQHTLGYRESDRLFVDAMEIEFKRSQSVRCGHCGRDTRFEVDRIKKTFDKSVELKEN